MTELVHQIAQIAQIAQIGQIISRARSRRRLLALPLLALAVACGIGLSVRAAARPEPRTITLLARGMAFYLPGETVPNPRLLVERGEELRFVLRNEDQGMAHDLATLGKATGLLEEVGETAELTVRAPAIPGEHEYLCSLHPRLMRGLMEVR